MATAFATNVNPFMMQHQRNRMLGKTHMAAKQVSKGVNKENICQEQMEISPFNKMSAVNGCKERVGLQRIGCAKENMENATAFGICSRQVKDKQNEDQKVSKKVLNLIAQKQKPTPGKKQKKGKLSNRSRLLNFGVMKPNPSAIMDDDLLPMEVDIIPTQLIRQLQVKVPMEILQIESKLADKFGTREYAQEIYQYLQHVERRWIYPDRYLEDHNCEVTPHMRSILTDWLIDVQVHQELSEQSLHMTVTLVDRFLSLQKISLSMLQLVGITCLLIATKYCERFPPEVKTLCYLTDNSFSKEQVITMECIILKELKFDLNIVDPSVFLDTYLEIEADGREKEVANMSKYILDLSITDHKMVHFNSSTMAASALLLARRILAFTCPWTVGLAYYSRYSEKDLAPCVRALGKLLMNASESKFQGARKKYSSKSQFGAIVEHPNLKNKDIVSEAAHVETTV